MRSAAELVLAGVVADGRLDRLETLARSYPPEVFQDSTDQRLYRALVEYLGRFRAVLPPQALKDYLADEVDEVKAQVARLWVALSRAPVPDDQWQWAVSSLVDNYRDQEGASALATAAQILLTGAPLPDGRGGTEVRRGFEAAREYVVDRLGEVDRRTSPEETAPSLSLSSSYDFSLSLLGSAGSGVHFPLNIPAIDAATSGGPKIGTLWFVAAYAGEGKTTFAVSVAAYQAILAGLNVVYFTGETLLSTVQGRLVCRHSRDPRFEVPGGISYQDAITNRLDPEARAAWAATASDLQAGAGDGRYGELVVQQMPLRHTFDGILDTLRQVERSFPVHVLIVDSIDMVRTPTRGYSYREVLSETIEQFASLAVSYAGGRGLAVISPYQVSRAAYQEAIDNSARYTLAALSETSMAERRASTVVSLLRIPESPGTLRAQLLKNREGPEAEFELDIDYRSAYIGPGAGGGSLGASIGFGDLLG